VSAPIVLPLAALEVRLTDAGNGRVAVWLAAVGSDASERIATLKLDATDPRGWHWDSTPAVMPDALFCAVGDALEAHFAAATP